jgi:hypothetical protein
LIFKFLHGASAEERRHFLDMGDDEGRVFVVTADAPECQDLRHWLQSVIEAQAGKDEAFQSAEMPPGAGNLEFTQDFTMEALRQTLRSPASVPASPSSGPRAAQSPVPSPEKAPGVLKPPPQIPSISSDVTDPGPTDLSGLWEKSSPARPAGLPASITVPPTSPRSPDGPSGVPEVTAQFLGMWSSQNSHDAPFAAISTPEAQAADRERPPATMAGPVEAKGNVDPYADLLLARPDVLQSPVAPSKAEVSNPSPQFAVTPAAQGPGAKTPRMSTGPLGEDNKAQPQAAASTSSPAANDKPEAGAKLTENVPRRRIPEGFEVVYQSSKRRSRPTLSGLPDKPGIMPAPAPIAPPAVTPAAGKVGGSLAIYSPSAPGGPRQAAGAIEELPAPPLPPQAEHAVKDIEQTTRLGPAPLMPPASVVSQTPPGDSPLIGRASPSILAPGHTTPNRDQPDEYTRLFENIRPAVAPLPLGVPPPGYQSAANPAVSTSAPAQASYLSVTASQTQPYHGVPPEFQTLVSLPHDKPSHSAGKKRKVWVPILILSSLFMMTVALLLFFALKH